MADTSAGPGGHYYSGRPAATHDQHKAAPPPPSEPVDGRVNASEVPGYYAGGPAAKHGAGAGAGAGQGSAAPNKEPGFFASCCACFSGGETAR